MSENLSIRNTAVILRVNYVMVSFKLRIDKFKSIMKSFLIIIVNLAFNGDAIDASNGWTMCELCDGNISKSILNRDKDSRHKCKHVATTTS